MNSTPHYILSVQRAMDSYPSAIPNQLPIKSVPGQWTTGLYDCCDDPSSCILTIFCPCITFGRIAEILDEGATSCNSAAFTYYCFSSCSWISAIAYRTKLRRMYSLEEEPCSDCYVHCWCNNCALMQVYRELNNRGIDPTIGWKANVEKGNLVRSKLPPRVPSGMAR